MRRWIRVSLLLLGASAFPAYAACSDADLERHVVRVLRIEGPDVWMRNGDKWVTKATRDPLAELRAIGRVDDVRSCLLDLVFRHRHTRPGTGKPEDEQELGLLKSALLMLGNLRDQEASPLLGQLLFDESLDGSVRGDIASALARIDADGNAPHLIRVLHDCETLPAWSRSTLVSRLARLSADLGVASALEACAARERHASDRGAMTKAARAVRERKKAIAPPQYQ